MACRLRHGTAKCTVHQGGIKGEGEGTHIGIGAGEQGTIKCRVIIQIAYKLEK